MQKIINVEGIEQPIVLARRKGTKNLKISIKGDGQVRVSVPYGVPEMFAKRFVREKADWIIQHQKPQNLIRNGAHIGKNHILTILTTDAGRHSTKITATAIRVTLPEGSSETSLTSQKIIKTACDKALLHESKILLPQRLEYISKKHSITYKTGSIKKLKSRWGACDNYSNISLNSYLIQLDWSLIDYVICHELAHTVHHNHQSKFWKLVESISPNYKELRKKLKTLPTDIIPTKF